MAAGVRRGEGSRPLFELVQGRSPLVCCCRGGEREGDFCMDVWRGSMAPRRLGLTTRVPLKPLWPQKRRIYQKSRRIYTTNTTDGRFNVASLTIGHLCICAANRRGFCGCRG